MDGEIESVWWLSSNHEIGSNASRSGGCLHLTARDLGQTFSTQDLGLSKAFPPKVKLKVTDHRASAAGVRKGIAFVGDPESEAMGLGFKWHKSVPSHDAS